MQRTGDTVVLIACSALNWVKKRNKLVQVRIGDGSCAHGKDGAAVVLVSMKQGALEK